MIYISSPYTSKTSEIRYNRVNETRKFLAWVINKNVPAISIPVHFHSMISDCLLTVDNSFWYTYFPEVLKTCDSMYVLMLEGWRESEGVAAEIKLASELGIPTRFFVVIGSHYEEVIPVGVFSVQYKMGSLGE